MSSQNPEMPPVNPPPDLGPPPTPENTMPMDDQLLHTVLSAPENINLQTTPQVQQSPELPYGVLDSEIKRNITPLKAYAEKDTNPKFYRQKAADHILKVAGIIQENTARVSYDFEQNKPKDRWTEHDPERAHLIALTVDKNMTELAQGPRKKVAERHLEAVKLGQRLASTVYDTVPMHANLATVAAAKQAEIKVGYNEYKQIKSV
jgi:hypothetical protein